MNFGSSYISAVVLVAALMSVLAFSFAIQQTRYMYISQLSSKILASQEAVSAGTVVSGPLIVTGIRNVGSRVAVVKVVSIEAVSVVNASKIEDGSVVWKAASFTTRRDYYNITLKPMDGKLLFYNVSEDPAVEQFIQDAVNYTIDVAHVAVMLTTERNVFVYDPSPPMDAALIPVTPDMIGKSVSVSLPNGRKVNFTILEYLMCAVGDRELDSYPPTIDASKILVAYRDPNTDNITSRVIFYNYGYDPLKGKKVTTQIYIDITEIRFVGGGSARATVCDIRSEANLGGGYAAVSRGVILIGSGFGSYEVAVVLRSSSSGARYVDPSSVSDSVVTGVSAASVRTSFFITKIPLPNRGSDPFSFMGTNIVPTAYGVDSRSVLVDVSDYYSEAVVVGDSVVVFLSGSDTSYVMYTVFPDEYPFYILLAPAQYMLEG